MMIEYTSGYKGDKITDVELSTIGTKLKQFVDAYRKYVLINNPNQDQNNPNKILSILDDISHKMITKQYDQLFDDITIVDMNISKPPW